MAIARDDETVENTVSRILNARQQREKQEAVLEEKKKEYIKALNGMAATPNGQFVLDILIKVCGVFSADDSQDAATLIRNAERRNVYMNYIRPYLEPEVRKELENK